jgi:hypothetical protein
MKKKLIIIGIITLLVTIGLSGCNQISNTLNTERNRFFGTWSNSQVHDDGMGPYTIKTTITFLSDGTVSWSSLLTSSGTWDLKDGKLVMNVQLGDSSNIVINNYSFSNNDKTLSLTDVNIGGTTVYTKQ